MKKLMILGGSILQLPAIQKAKEMDLEVIVVDMNPDAIGFKEKGVIKEVISTIDIPKVLECAKKHKINGIMTLASDMPMRTIANVSKEMGIIGISMDTALKTTDKIIMRKALKNNGVSVPIFYEVNSKEEFYMAVKSLEKKNYKCIVKPSDNSGSRGVSLINDYQEEEIWKAYEHGKDNSRSGNLIVEEYMEGPEISVETLSVNGTCHIIQITDKITTGAPYFVEMGHTQPSQLNDVIKKKVCDITKQANFAVGIKDGPSHTEIKITKDGPKIVELGARLGGDCITTHLVPLSTGVDIVKCCIDIAMGEIPDFQVKYSKGSAIRYLKTGIGKIEAILGISDAKKMKGIEEISIIHNVGNFAREIESSNDRVGFVIAQGENAKTAARACMDAIMRIDVKVK